MHREVARTLDQLTRDEKVSLLSGRDVWHTVGIDRLGVGAVKVTDGPNGARGDGVSGTRAICLPASIGLAATFDHDLATEVGALLGLETRRRGANVVLGPTVNLARHPLGGRNFESFGEDPLLTSQLSVALVDGVQSQGVGACAKHLVANDVEHARLTVDYVVDEAVLQELYLAPFEALARAGVWTMMAAYPKLNGEHCTEHAWLLTDVARGQWGYDGLIMSDWGATHHRSRPVAAGLDLEMPGPAVALGSALAAAIDEGELDPDVLDERAASVLELARRSGRLANAEVEAERSVDEPDERLLARRAAADAVVLLTNRDDALPLAPGELSRVAVVGPNADPGVIQGGGSAQVRPHHAVAPLQGLVDALGADRVDHQQGCLAHRYLPNVPAEHWQSIELERFASADLGQPPVEATTATTIAAFVHGRPPGVRSQRWTGHLAIEASGRHAFSVLSVGKSRVLVDGVEVVDNWTAPEPGDAFFQYASAEATGTVELTAGTEAEIVVEWAHGQDSPLLGLRFGHLPPVDEDELLSQAEAAASAADAAVVVVGLDHEWESEGHDRLAFELPGRQDELIERVCRANPRTVVVVNAGAPVAAPWLDQPAATLMAWYGGQEQGAALADVLLGQREPGGRLPVTWPRDLADTPFKLPPHVPGPPAPGTVLAYEEGLLIGYRSYDRHRVEPLLPFGHGLGYTTFELGAPEASEDDDGVAVTVPVTNVGERPGKCVVQVYAEPLDDDDPTRPIRVLAGFASRRLAAGASDEVTVSVPARALARWDTAGQRWVDPGGPTRFHLGWSSRDLVRSVDLTRTAGESAGEAGLSS